MGSPVVAVEDLNASVRKSLEAHRPLLHHLNADTSWLLQLPRPASQAQNSTTPTPKHWYNILIDPWLNGPQSDVASWFSTQWHSDQPAFPSIARVEQLVRQTEIQAQEWKSDAVCNPSTISHDIDLVLISHEFTDHMHKQTLLELDRSVPVLATEKACALIHKWHHFDSVQKTPSFLGPAADWRTNRQAPLPAWLSVSRIVNKADALYYHSALLIAFSLAEQDNAEALIYTPHGVNAPCLQSIADAQPPIRTLAFLHGLHAIQISRQQLNLGAHNGLHAQRILKSQYWVATHDEKKMGRGFVGWLLRRQEFSVHDAIREEKARNPRSDLGDRVGFFELQNGQVAVLA